MSRRIAALLCIAILAAALSAAGPGANAAKVKGFKLGVWKKPIAEIPKFARRPPRTPKESTKVPPAVSMAMMPDGRVVYWGGLESLEDGKYPLAADAPNEVVSSRTRVLDLRRRTPRWTTPTPQDTGKHDLFCADQRLLVDGRIIAVGGTIWEADPVENPTGEPAGTGELFGSNATRFFDYRDEGWSFNEDFMHYSRWYPTLITLPSGKLLVASGVERLLYNDRGINVHQTETFDPATGKWSENGPEGEVSLPLFARLHLLPTGRVFYSGVGQMWGPFGQAYDEALWNSHMSYDPTKNEWVTTGSGIYGARSGALSVMLPLKPPYNTAKILVAGGTLGTSPGSYMANNLTEVLSIEEDGRSVSVAGPPLNNNRWYSSGVLLPTGRVLAVSGGDKDEVISPASEVPVRQAELFTGKRWKPLRRARRIRTYHNSAILLPDASVLVGGHAPINDGYGPTGNPEPATGTNNLKDPSFEVYKPPYLFRGKRPKITSLRKGIAWGTTFNLRTTRAKKIKRVVLMRLPSTTHITDADMRAVNLPFSHRGGRRLSVAAPPNGNVAPPGFYYTFVLRKTKSRGLIPSKARIVRVDARPLGGQARAPMGR